MTVKTNIAELLASSRAQLAEIGDTPSLDAEILLAQVLGKSRSYLYTWPERIPTAMQLGRFNALLTRRLAGEPAAYLIGRREFWSMDLQVTPATLIPRPETELLVELALQRIASGLCVAVADLGTGNGAIALAIARERPRARIVATDVSAEALAVAKDNARQLAMSNVAFKHGNWCAALGRERFAVLVSNPPYVATGDPYLQRRELQYEPRLALVAGTDGLDAIRIIISQAMSRLQPGGWLLLEHGYDQGESVPALLRARGFKRVTDHRDMLGNDRVSCGYWSGH